ncbi:hypothetical protein MK852_10685 [Shewanella benthica]|nr:hypothetical protein [Shewanella benthica]
MALKINNIEQIKLNNIREGHLCLRVLTYDFRGNFSRPFPENKSRCESIINSHIQEVFGQEGLQNAERVVPILESAIIKNLLPDSSFDWLDVKNSRLIYFIWFYLRVSDEPDLLLLGNPPQPLFIMKYHSEASSINGIYNKMGGNLNPANSKERLKEIIDFFDKCHADTQSLKNFLDHLKSYSHNCLSDRKSVTWLSAANTIQTDWAWNYLLSEQMINDMLKPLNDVERYNAIVVTLDSWLRHPAEKELFVLRMKKAWSQKKHRDGLVGKKAYNITMSNDVQGMLEELAERSDSKINKTLEKLIRREYKKVLDQ